MRCTHCGTEVDGYVIDHDMPQAAFCSEDCLREAHDKLPGYVAPVIFPEKE